MAHPPPSVFLQHQLETVPILMTIQFHQRQRLHAPNQQHPNNVRSSQFAGSLNRIPANEQAEEPESHEKSSAAQERTETKKNRVPIASQFPANIYLPPESL